MPKPNKIKIRTNGGGIKNNWSFQVRCQVPTSLISLWSLPFCSCERINSFWDIISDSSSSRIFALSSRILMLEEERSEFCRAIVSCSSITRWTSERLTGPFGSRAVYMKHTSKVKLDVNWMNYWQNELIKNDLIKKWTDNKNEMITKCQKWIDNKMNW